MPWTIVHTSVRKRAPRARARARVHAARRRAADPHRRRRRRRFTEFNGSKLPCIWPASIFELCGAELADVCEVVTLTLDGKIFAYAAMMSNTAMTRCLSSRPRSSRRTPSGSSTRAARPALRALPPPRGARRRGQNRLRAFAGGRRRRAALPPLVRACISKQVLLSHCPGVYAKPMAQYCLAYILQILRRVPEHAHNQSTKIQEPRGPRRARRHHRRARRRRHRHRGRQARQGVRLAHHRLAAADCARPRGV